MSESNYHLPEAWKFLFWGLFFLQLNNTTVGAISSYQRRQRKFDWMLYVNLLINLITVYTPTHKNEQNNCTDMYTCTITTKLHHCPRDHYVTVNLKLCLVSKSSLTFFFSGLVLFAARFKKIYPWCKSIIS